MEGIGAPVQSPMGRTGSLVPERWALSGNILANGASQVVLVVAALTTMPFFLRRMGAEAYGLIGFFTLMTAWFQILDAGLSLTLSRECARYRAGAIDAVTLRALTSALEMFFFAVAGIGAVVIAAGAHAIAASWLRVHRLPTAEVANAVLLMGLTVPLQWVTGLYRGAINGFERQVWLSGFNIAMTVLRFGGAAAAITLLGPAPVNFFAFQLAVSTLELAVLIAVGRGLLPPVARRRALKASEIRSLLKFSSSLAFAVLIWVLVTQIDKLILSRILSLADYGLFTLAVVAAGGVLALGTPISQALLPRLTRLCAENADAEVVRLYRAVTQLVCIITIPCAAALAAFSRPVIWVWTGQASLALTAGPILTAYALGNGVMTLGAFPYYLQYAKGDLRLHVVGNILLVALLIPTIVLAASRFGAVGAGYAWFGLNALYLLIWVPWTHARLARGLHWRWLTSDVLPIAGAVALAAWGMDAVLIWPRDRIAAALQLAVLAGLLLGVAVCASSIARQTLVTAARGVGARLKSYPA